MADPVLTFTATDEGAAARYVILRLRAALAVDTPACAATALSDALDALSAGGADPVAVTRIGKVAMRLHEARLLLTENTDQDDDGG